MRSIIPASASIFPMIHFVSLLIFIFLGDSCITTVHTRSTNACCAGAIPSCQPIDIIPFTKTRNIPSKAVYERIFEWAGHPLDHGESENPSIEKMQGPVADAEVDLLIESANYFMFIEAKVCQKPGETVRFQRNKKEYGAIHQLVRQFVQGRLLASQIHKEFMLATLGASDGDFVQIELREGDRRLLQAVEQSEKHFPSPVPNFSWNLLPD